jgi:hypothetical protein
VSKTNNFIELNGKRYDAVTGAFLGSGSQPVSSKPLAHTVKPAANHGMVMDGIKPPKSVVHHVALASHPHPETGVAHHIKPIAHHKPQHAKTLRRDIVKQPSITPQKPLKLQAPTDLIQHKPGVLALTPKLSSDIIDPARAGRSLDVPRSPKIERFRKLPTPRQSATTTLSPIRPSHRPVESFSRAPARVAPRHVLPIQQSKDDDIFEQAIAYARSHEQPSPAPHHAVHKTKRTNNRKHKRLVGAFASVLMLAFLGGFIFWQNRADIELQLASARSGVPASMPAYKPSGYAVKGLTYSPGTVTIGFGTTTGSSFNVVQKTSNWDSETLLQNYVATSGQAYNAYSAAGRTVYVYGDGNATWVNGGIWYQVNDNGQLDKDQIINLATSM